MGIDGSEMSIQYVYVSWLKNPSSMPPGVKQQLDAAGLGETDYQNILGSNADPFVGARLLTGGFGPAPTSIDPNRFLPLAETYPYEGPVTAADPVPVTLHTIKNSVTQTSTHASEVQYGASLSASTGKAIVSLQATASLTWTNSSSSSEQSESIQSASVAIGGPAFGYSGPTNILVYWDTVYGTFMFSFT
jgi:hypothetical protein